MLTYPLMDRLLTIRVAQTRSNDIHLIGHAIHRALIALIKSPRPHKYKDGANHRGYKDDILNGTLPLFSAPGAAIRGFHHISF